MKIACSVKHYEIMKVGRERIRSLGFSDWATLSDAACRRQTLMASGTPQDTENKTG
jgi:hypothetical protein